MKVVCIDNIFRGERISFTIGGVYETVCSICVGGPAAQYSVISDDGVLYNLSTSRFIKLEEWRDLQLEKLVGDGI